MTLKEKYQRFKVWQQQPYQVAPLSDEEHCCLTCGTVYVGNFCPRCGQSANMGRYSFKKAFMLFLDVWGMGNRSMPRTIRDLILRPGYMIRDYLRGRYMAYFPPFKMFFLLIALSLIVASGVNIMGKNQLENQRMEMEASFSDKKAESASSEKAKEFKTIINHLFLEGDRFVSAHSAISMLIWVLMLTVPLFWMFRHAPSIQDINYSEFFVGSVFINNMSLIYSIVFSFFCLSDSVDDAFSLLIPIFPLKQLSGYSYWQTSLRYIASMAVLIGILVLLAVVLAGLVIVYMYLFKGEI